MSSNKPLVPCTIKKSSKAKLIGLISEAASLDRIDWHDQFRRARQVIAFGSYAVGYETPQSDIDILCIGRGRSCRSDRLQILWMPQSRLDEHKRRGSELACHVASFGVWLKGPREFPSKIAPSRETIRRRRDQISARCRALLAQWNRLTPAFQQKHIQKIRRDLQRLALLKQGNANIPAPALDAAWTSHPQTTRAVKDCLADDNELLGVLTPKLVRHLQSSPDKHLRSHQPRAVRERRR